MADSTKNLLDLIFDKFRELVRDEIKSAFAERRPPKLQYTTKEAAEILNVPESWLAAKARAGEVPYRVQGHYRLFTMADIQAIIDKGHVQAVQYSHERQGVSANPEAAGIESGKTGGSAEDDSDDGGEVGKE